MEMAGMLLAGMLLGRHRSQAQHRAREHFEICPSTHTKPHRACCRSVARIRTSNPIHLRFSAVSAANPRANRYALSVPVWRCDTDGREHK